jgi:phosphate transport system permease protein
MQERSASLPLFQGEPLGFGMLAAGIILAIMIVPTIASISREVLRAVPDIHREAAIGLGATRWDTSSATPSCPRPAPASWAR